MRNSVFEIKDLAGVHKSSSRMKLVKTASNSEHDEKDRLRHLLLRQRTGDDSFLNCPEGDEEGKPKRFDGGLNDLPHSSSNGSLPHSQPFNITNMGSFSHRQQSQTSSTYEDPVAADIFTPSPFNALAARTTTELVVDHTYRDYSGIKPNDEDRRRHATKKKDVASLLRIKDSSNISSTERKTNPEDSMVQKNTKSKLIKNSSEDLKICLGTNFPSRLHGLLSHGNGLSGIITWLPHGRAWIVLDKERFLERVAPLCFQVTYENSSALLNRAPFKFSFRLSFIMHSILDVEI